MHHHDLKIGIATGKSQWIIYQFLSISKIFVLSLSYPNKSDLEVSINVGRFECKLQKITINYTNVTTFGLDIIIKVIFTSTTTAM